MQILDLKKAGASLLMLAIVTGCTSNSPVNVAKAPETKTVTSLKAAEVTTIDLGAKNGRSVRLNLTLRDKEKFAIKVDFPTNTTILPLNGFNLALKLFRQPIGMPVPSPKDRFNAPKTLTGTDIGNVSEYNIPSPKDVNVVNYTGLQAGFDYFITARIYSPAFND
jgi:hypothetical protein